MNQLVIKDEKWRDSFEQLVRVVEQNIPQPFEKTVDQYGMICFQVPLQVYPQGYHCAPNTALPFISIAAQKKHLALYHLGIYANDELLHWFEQAYKSEVQTKVNMGKSCIRFTNEKTIPYNLIAQLVQKMTVDDWITLYEAKIKQTK